MIRSRLVRILALLGCTSASLAGAAVPATPFEVWRTQEVGANVSSGSRQTARLLADGSVLVAELASERLSMTRFGGSGSILSNFVVGLTGDFGYSSSLALAIGAAGEVYAAVNGTITKWDAATGAPLWPAVDSVPVSSMTALALDPEGDLLVAGSPWNGGVTVARLHAGTGKLAMGPVLLGLEYGNFRGLALDPEGNPVVAGSSSTGSSIGIAKISRTTGFGLWGPVTIAASSLAEMRCTESGDLFVLERGGGLTRLSSAGAVAYRALSLGSANATMDVDGEGGVYVATWGSSSSTTARFVTPQGITAWQSVLPYGNGYSAVVRVAAHGAADAAVFVSDTDWSGAPTSETYLRLRRAGDVWTSSGVDPAVAVARILVAPDGDLVTVGRSSSGTAVTRFDESGFALWSIATPPLPAAVDTWSAAATDASGDVLLASTSANPCSVRVRKASGVDGHALWDTIVPLTGSTSCYWPLNLATDPQGHVTVFGPGYTDFASGRLSGVDGTPLRAPVSVTFAAGEPVAALADRNGDLLVLRRVYAQSGYTTALMKFSTVTGALAWGPIAWQSADALGDFLTSLTIDSSGNAVVGGLSNVSTGGTRGVVLSFAAADGTVLWGPLQLDDPGSYSSYPAVYSVRVTASPEGSIFATATNSSSSTPILFRRIDAAGHLLWGPLPSPVATDSGVWAQAADPSGDLVVCAGYSPTQVFKIRGSDAAAVWATRTAVSGTSATLLIDADGNLALTQSSSLYRLAGADGSLLWEPLYPGAISALRGPDVIIAGGGSAGAVAARITGGIGVAPPADGSTIAACGQPFALDLVAVNGRAPLAWSVVSGALPAGLTLSSAGHVAGTLIGEGTYAVRVQVSDADGKTAGRDLQFVVADVEPYVAVSATSLAPCRGETVTLSVAGSWIAYRWLPGGATTPTVDVAVVEPTTYGVVVMDAGGCARHGSLTIAPLPSTETPRITAPAFARVNAAGFVASVPAHAGHTWAWTISGGAITAGQGTNQITFSTGAAGPLTISVRESEPGVCTSLPATATVRVSDGTFFPIVPCRVLDTRNPDGPQGGPSLAAGSTRVVTVAGICGIPFGARAVVANVTSVVPPATGDLRVGPGDATAASLPPIPLLIGRIRAMATVLGLASNGDGTVLFSNGSTGSVDVLLDVSGYFR